MVTTADIKVVETAEAVISRRFTCETVLTEEDLTKMFSLSERGISRWSLDYNESEFIDGVPTNLTRMTLKAYDSNDVPVYLIRAGWSQDSFRNNLDAIVAEYLNGQGIEVAQNIKVVYNKEQLDQRLLPVVWHFDRVDKVPVDVQENT